jgi:hypothetical protein
MQEDESGSAAFKSVRRLPRARKHSAGVYSTSTQSLASTQRERGRAPATEQERVQRPAASGTVFLIVMCPVAAAALSSSCLMFFRLEQHVAGAGRRA